MIDEAHRQLAIDAYQAYESGNSDLGIQSFRLSQLGEKSTLKVLHQPHMVYVLRLNPERTVDPTVLAIPNKHDARQVLYIGGHTSKKSERFNKLINACRSVQRFYSEHGYANNDKKGGHGHTVAGCLTTSLLRTGFSIADCIMDVFSGAPQYDELEFIIGYEEKFHQLPPWNSIRRGASLFPESA